ncbi:MAG: endonuclease [Bacilli bacterium]|nr:endonuclease [Bacilli bacterium]
MKKRALTFILTSVLAVGYAAVIGGFVAQSRQDTDNVIVEKAVAAEGNYYSGISDSLSGTDLLNALNTLNNSKKTKDVTYNGMRQFAATCDADPNGSGKIVGFYDNALIGPSWDSGSTWNREHVWPNVRGGSYVEADAHMVRPAATSTNSDRGSKGFGTESFDPGKYVAYYRGAAARIIFYAAIADTRLSIVDFAFNYNGVQNGNSGYPTTAMGCLSDMLQWNLQYLPSDTSFTGANDLARRVEIQRNERIQTASGGQGNRNPFIDHPEYACKIWGNTNDKTRQICAGAVATSTVTLDKDSLTLEVGQTATLKATSSNGGNISWVRGSTEQVTLSTTTTASGSTVTVTAIAPGNTTITAKNADQSSATCSVTVNAQSVPLKLNETNIHLDIGEKAELIATTNDQSPVTFTFEDVAYKILGFGSSTAASGQPLKLTGLANGTTTITVTSTNGGSATCVVTVGTGQYVEPSKPKSGDRNKNLPLIIGLGGGGGAIVLAGLIVLIVLLVKKKPV